VSDVEFRFRELERRMGLAESTTSRVPVIARDIEQIKEDLREVKDDQGSIRRALYTAAISVAVSAILFVYGATELFK
jgi:phage-related protein